MAKNALYSLPKKSFGLVCVEVFSTKEVKRINWLDAYELVETGVAKFVPKSALRDYNKIDAPKAKKEEPVVSEAVEAEKPKLKRKEIRAKDKKGKKD